MTAPIASGWSGLPGGACTHWKAPPLHGAHPQRTLGCRIEIESSPRISSVPMTSPGCGAGLLVCCGRDHHHATVAYAAFGDDVIGEMLDVAGGSFQRRHLHAAVVVEMNVQRRQRQIVVAMEVLHQALGQIARGVVVDIHQRRHALPRRHGVLRSLLQARAGQIANDFGPVLVAAILRGGVDFREQVVLDGDGDPLHCNPDDWPFFSMMF
jgi:hypothetical protein